MKKIFLGILIMVVLASLTVGGAFALPTLPERLPDTAKKASRAIDDVTGKVKAPPEFVAQLPESELTKIVFIRFAPGKEPKCDNDGVCEPGENWKNCPSDCKKGGEEEEPKAACYAFLAGSKPRWNWLEDYHYSKSDLGATAAWATDTWEASASAEIFKNGISGDYPWSVYNYINSISYGDYDDTGICPTSEPCVLAITALWYRGKNIYEYDIMFDTDFFPGNFDLPTVSLHEFGHAAGLDDLYDTACVDNIMYGYLGEGEIKRTPGAGDTTGIQILY